MKRLIKFDAVWIDLEEIAGCEAYQQDGAARVKISLKSGSTFFLGGEEAEDLAELLDRWSIRLDACSRALHSPADPSWGYSPVWERLLEINNLMTGAIAVLVSPVAEDETLEADENLRRIFGSIEVLALKSLDLL